MEKLIQLTGAVIENPYDDELKEILADYIEENFDLLKSAQALRSKEKIYKAMKTLRNGFIYSEKVGTLNDVIAFTKKEIDSSYYATFPLGVQLMSSEYTLNYRNFNYFDPVKINEYYFDIQMTDLKTNLECIPSIILYLIYKIINI